MLPLFLIPLALQAGKGIYDTVAGGINARRARREQKQLLANRPQRQIPQGELDMLSLLQNRASQGLSDATLNRYQEGAERGLTSTLDAIIKGGGTPNSIGGAYQDYLNDISALTLANDQAQLQNVNNFLNQNRRISDYQDRQYEENVYQPWADQMTATAQEVGQAEGRQASGINTIGNAVGNYFGQLNQKNDIQGLFGRGVNLLGQTVNKMAPTSPASTPGMTQQQFGNTLTGAAMGMNNGYFGVQPQRYSPNLNAPMRGYDFSGLKPSDRAMMVQLFNNYQY